MFEGKIQLMIKNKFSLDFFSCSTKSLNKNLNMYLLGKDLKNGFFFPDHKIKNTHTISLMLLDAFQKYVYACKKYMATLFCNSYLPTLDILQYVNTF